MLLQKLMLSKKRFWRKSCPAMLMLSTCRGLASMVTLTGRPSRRSCL
uniref:Uncharacterized protein n=1 Tax=Rhizophora mucronata TaxID=61149 RepID=A0A2P2IT11_RHIMU